jgi:hypothetical protein
MKGRRAPRNQKAIEARTAAKLLSRYLDDLVEMRMQIKPIYRSVVTLHNQTRGLVPIDREMKTAITKLAEAGQALDRANGAINEAVSMFTHGI